MIKALTGLLGGRVRPNVLSAIIRTGSTGAILFLAPAILGKIEFGLYSYAYWIAFFSLQVGLFGVPSFICRTPTNQMLPLATFAGVVFTVQAITFLLLLGSSAVVLDFSVKLSALAISCFGGANSIVLALCRQRSRFKVIFISELAGGFMRLSGVAFLCWNNEATPLTLLASEALSQCAQLGTLLITTRGALLTDISPSKLPFSQLRELGGLGLIGLVDAILWQRTETWFLTLSPDPEASIATFSFALRIATAGIFIPAAVIDAWFPSLANANSMLELRKMLRRFGAFYGAYALISGVAAIVLILTIYRQFLCVEAVALIIFRLFEGVVGFGSAVVYARKGERFLWPAIAGSALVSIAVNLLLTPKLGLVGATTSYIIAHGILAAATILIYSMVTRREIALGRLSPLDAPA